MAVAGQFARLSCSISRYPSVQLNKNALTMSTSDRYVSIREIFPSLRGQTVARCSSRIRSPRRAVLFNESATPGCPNRDVLQTEVEFVVDNQLRPLQSSLRNGIGPTIWPILPKPPCPIGVFNILIPMVLSRILGPMEICIKFLFFGPERKEPDSL